jgi:hypothetical protein
MTKMAELGQAHFENNCRVPQVLFHPGKKLYLLKALE